MNRRTCWRESLRLATRQDGPRKALDYAAELISKYEQEVARLEKLLIETRRRKVSA